MYRQQCAAQQPQLQWTQSLEIQPAHRRSQESIKQVHSFGGIHINTLLIFFIPLLIFACLYCYHSAVTKKEEPVFPHATITSTACHYSQDIVFRYLMLPAGGFICLVYYIAYRWLKLLKKKTQYPGPLFGQLYYWGQASVLGFYGAIATIDELDRPPIHGIGAVFFFIMLFIISTSITIVLRDIHEWDSSMVNSRSIMIKVVVSAYLFVIVMYFIVGSILQNSEEDNGEDIYLVTVEWNLTIGGLGWLLTFVLDLKDVQLTFKGDAQETIKYIK